MADNYNMEATKKLKKANKPNIYSYHQYRSFLNDWVEYLRTEKGLSLRTLSVNSCLAVGYLPMVLSGKRPLTNKALGQLEHSLELDMRSFQFLRCLRELNEATDQKGMLRAYNKIKRFKQYKDANNQEIESHKLLSAWYYVAIREMAHLKNFSLDPKWIQKNMKKKVSVREIKRAVQFLLKSGFMHLTKDGKVEIPDKGIECYGGIFKLTMAEFHQQMLGLATDSIHETESELRNLLTHTMAISKDQLPELKEILNETLRKIQELGDKTVVAEEVYQVSLLTFPLTERQKMGSGGKDD